MSTSLCIGDSMFIGAGRPLALMAGPCVIESEEHLIKLGGAIKAVASELGLPFVLKSSFDKANRSSPGSYRGPGMEAGLRILAAAKQALGVPILCDIHLPEQAAPVAAVADLLQIPAFLCRQTDLICAAARTGKPVNIKKGQFVAPLDMHGAVAKALACGAPAVMLTERGFAFGYNNLVVDMRALSLMRTLGCPVMFDGTHSVQLPGGLGTCSGGERQFIPPLVRAAVAAGLDALFLEVHEAPERAPCDGSNMLALADLPALLRQVIAIDAVVKAGYDGDNDSQGELP